MEHSIFCAERADCSRSSSAFLPMVDMPEARWRSLCGAPGAWKLEIVKRSNAAGFEVLPKQ